MAADERYGEFDPRHLTTEASLNRTRLAELPGAEKRWVGRPAFDLLSLAALEQLAADEDFLRDWERSTSPEGTARVPGRPGGSGRDGAAGGGGPGGGRGGGGRGVTWSLASALHGNHPRIASRAARIAEEFGRRLGHLIATLADPNPSDAAPSAWRAAYLGYWRRVEQVWLGGGIAAALGEPFVAAAHVELERMGARVIAVEVAPHPGVLTLVGAARSWSTPEVLQAGDQLRSTPEVVERGQRLRSKADIVQPDPQLRSSAHAVVLDFGHTAVKRGIATVSDGHLTHLQVLPPRGVPVPAGGSTAGAAVITDFVVSTLAETWLEARERHGRVDQEVVVSLASYLSVAARPIDTYSLYLPLASVDLDRLVGARLTALAGRTVLTGRTTLAGHTALTEPSGLTEPSELTGHTARTGRSATRVHVRFLHDGTAAARALAADQHAAVILLGTALGVGFPAPVPGLLPVSPDLIVESSR